MITFNFSNYYLRARKGYINLMIFTSYASPYEKPSADINRYYGI